MPVAGPFYFAQISDGDVEFDPDTHGVMDFYIFSFNLQQAETEFASLEIEIKNPGVAALLAGPLWCWFSKDDEPLFKGRLVAIPTNLLATVISLKYVARPDDYEDQREDLAQEIRDTGRPFWDPLFIDDSHQDDPDTALEAIASDWHTDRLDLEVSTSDILVGEDGTVSFVLGEAFIDDLDVQISEAPIQAVDVDATVQWNEQKRGDIGIGNFYWKGAGSASVGKAWPKLGDELAGGWTVAAADIAAFGQAIMEQKPITISISWQNKEKEHRNGDTMSVNINYSGPMTADPGGGGEVLSVSGTMGDEYHGTPASFSIEKAGVYEIPVHSAIFAVRTSLSVSYNVDRARTEKLSFTVRSDLQPVLRSVNDATVPEKISLSGKPVQELIGVNGAASYFMTERGDWSVEYLILLAVARLKLASRVVKVTWGTTFERAMELTCRKSASIADPRLQNGQAVGKITAYRMEGNGDSGEFKGSCTIGCAVGLGNALIEQEGTPTYCDADYVGNDYQMYEDAIVAIGAGDIGYSPPIIVPNDDGLIFPLTRGQVVKKLVAHSNEFVPPEKDGPVEAVEKAISIIEKSGSGEATLSPTPQSLFQKRVKQLQEMHSRIADDVSNFQSWLELELVDLTSAEFGSESTVSVANLVLPKQYNVST